MRCTSKMVAAVATVGVLAFGSQAEAQYPYQQSGYYQQLAQPVQPPQYYYQPPAQYYYPQQGLGQVTGNYTPYDPNRVIAQSGGSATYWDPYRGWVTNTRSDMNLQSYYSVGRQPASTLQNYTYWDPQQGQWVQGTRWVGRDGYYHGDEMRTRQGMSGTQREAVHYSPAVNPDGSYTVPNTGRYVPATRRVRGR